MFNRVCRGLASISEQKCISFQNSHILRCCLWTLSHIMVEFVMFCSLKTCMQICTNTTQRFWVFARFANFCSFCLSKKVGIAISFRPPLWIWPVMFIKLCTYFTGDLWSSAYIWSFVFYKEVYSQKKNTWPIIS